jgi:hypothetical protein
MYASYIILLPSYLNFATFSTGSKNAIFYGLDDTFPNKQLLPKPVLLLQCYDVVGEYRIDQFSMGISIGWISWSLVSTAVFANRVIVLAVCFNMGYSPY